MPLKAPQDLLAETLIKRTRAAALLLSPHGAMEPGTNGSYGDTDTPVRNTSHWLVSFCLAWRLTGDPGLRAAAERALNYLLACCAQFAGPPPLRHARGKDMVNGVLGPAHVIEGLFYGYRVLESRAARDAALALIERHPFDEALQAWRRVTPAGDTLSIDNTFNHQLYFAAAIALFAQGESKAKAEAERFCAGLHSTFAVSPGGRIRHSIPTPRGLRDRARSMLPASRDRAVTVLRETNYQSYNMYAFALLAGSGLRIPLTGTRDWEAAAAFLHGPEVQTRCTPRFWANGMASGMETAACDIAFFDMAFAPDAPADVARALEQLTYVDGPDLQCSLLTPDPVTQRARIYRYWRLLPVDWEVRGAVPVGESQP